MFWTDLNRLILHSNTCALSSSLKSPALYVQQGKRGRGLPGGGVSPEPVPSLELVFLLAKGLLEYEKISGQGWVDHLLPVNDGDW